MSAAKSVGATALVFAISAVGGLLLTLAPWLGKEAAFLVYYMLMMSISLLFVCRLRGIRLARSSFDLRLPEPSMLLSLVFGSAALLFGVIAAVPLLYETEKALGELNGQTGFLTFVLLVITAPTVEEAIFRGVILDGLLRRYSAPGSILLTSLLFGAFHLNPIQFVTGMVVGLFTGWVYYRSRSLIGCIAIHMSANAAVFIVRLLAAAEPGTSGDSSLAQSYGGIGMLGILGVLVLTALLCVRSLRRQFKQIGPAPAWFLASSNSASADPYP